MGIPRGAGGVRGGYGVLRLRKTSTSWASCFAQDDRSRRRAGVSVLHEQHQRQQHRALPGGQPRGLSPHLDRGLKPCSIFLRFGGTTGSRALPGLFLLAQGEQFWAALLFRERYYRATSKRLGSNEGDGLFRGQAWVSAGRWLHLTLTPAFFSACSRSTRACVPRGLKLSFILLLIAALKRCCHPTAPPSRLTSPLRFLVRRFRDQLLLGSLRRCWRGW